jgi:hypothetical protein
MTIIGFAKILGVIALLAPGVPPIKEGAYADFTFNLIGATASHLFVGDPVCEFAPPIALLLLGAVSDWMRPSARRLRALPSRRTIGATTS